MVRWSPDRIGDRSVMDRWEQWLLLAIVTYVGACPFGLGASCIESTRPAYRSCEPWVSKTAPWLLDDLLTVQEGEYRKRMQP